MDLRLATAVKYRAIKLRKGKLRSVFSFSCTFVIRCLVLTDQQLQHSKIKIRFHAEDDDLVRGTQPFPTRDPYSRKFAQIERA